MRVVISYDIASSKTRTRVSRILEGYAERVQQSVFEGVLPPRQYQRVWRHLARVALESGDSIRYYSLCGACDEKVALDGAGPVVRAPSYFIV